MILSCSCAGYRVTKITENSIKLGEYKETIVKKIGKPFKINSYTDNNKLFEIIYYKEAVDVSSYTYILTSILTFEDSKLIKIEQIEETTPDVLKIKTIRP